MYLYLVKKTDFYFPNGIFFKQDLLITWKYLPPIYCYLIQKLMIRQDSYLKYLILTTSFKLIETH